MRDDPSKTDSQGEQAKTRLFLPAPIAPVPGATAPHNPIFNASSALNKQEVRLPLAIILLSLVATTALVLGILFAVAPKLAHPQQSASPTRSPIGTSRATANTPPATDAAQLPPQGTTTAQGISILPTHFTVSSDCQPDNGYRCTVTLYAAQDISDDLQWRASSDSITTKFSPPNGNIGSGQQQQVIVYIYNACPYSGTLLFSVGDDTLTVPVSC